MGVEEITTEVMTWKECQYLLGTLSGGIGRLAWEDTERRTSITPVAYAMLDGDIVVRTGADSLTSVVGATGMVALLVDLLAPDRRQLAWAVHARGPIRLANAEDLEDWSGNRIADVLPPVASEQYLRISVETLTGTRNTKVDNGNHGGLHSPTDTLAAVITSI